ncbi:hypothetical protein SKAU_G00302600 [Synaphobranchus kaupii]|uniref:Uncharacterized protein n=1 Tax=Synaphobranchus kaupii TaxID=118154 RepID=A0A9Q1EW59_SYNKA|nr:hypothetical protein SKAU_G00302600 [Synaphobranchus kaupii]
MRPKRCNTLEFQSQPWARPVPSRSAPCKHTDSGRAPSSEKSQPRAVQPAALQLAVCANAGAEPEELCRQNP